RILLLFLLVLLGLKPQGSLGQSIPISSPILEDYLRRQQLLGNMDASYSFMVRPVFPLQAFGTGNAMLEGTFFDQKILIGDGLEKFITVPFNFKSQYNSSHAFGANDGAMIPNAGIQMLLSG